LKGCFFSCLPHPTPLLRDHLEAAGHTCVLKDAAILESSEVETLISQEKFNAGLIIQLYKAGRFLMGNRIPFGAIFGGTDINEDVKNEEKCRVMGAVLEEARFVVAFTHKIKELAATKDYSLCICNICYTLFNTIFAGILTKPSKSFDYEAFLQNAGIRHKSGHLHLYVLICGLRRVKDPLYLAEMFAKWHEKEPNVYLAIIGPMVDPVFTKEVENKLEEIDGVYLIKEIPQSDLQAVIKRSFALVNSSLSEGMSAAILEAMDLEVPVLARDIPGNSAIIKHEDTGLLFSTPQEFVQLSKRLMTEPELKRRIVSNAKRYVNSNHSWELERDTYQTLILNLQVNGNI
uniref:Glycosyltransferase 1 domain-containing protein 1 n=1 Tax=Xenopus tropicalis TaxID=8364 RepID=F7D247_XENTR